MASPLAGPLPEGSGPVVSPPPTPEPAVDALTGSHRTIGAATPSSATAETFRRVRLQTGFRLVVGVLLLGVTAIVQWHGGLPLAQQFDFVPLYAVIGFVFATSIPAALGLTRIESVRGLELLATAQFVVDVAITTALVYLTGGTESPFVFLYVLTIINASAILYRRGALLTGAASAIAYGMLVDLSYYGIIRPFAPEYLGTAEISSREALWRVSATTFGFLLTAVLGSYLSEAARRTGQELAARSIDLRALQVLTRNIVENISSGLLSVDGEGRITSFNRAAEEITGRTLASVYGLPLKALFPGVADRLLRRVSHEPRRYEEPLTRKDGVALTLGFSYSPLRNDAGDEIGTIVIFQDLTELREMEARLKREERLAAVGRLAAGIAHEIRNPLASISGSIEMLKGGDTGAGEDQRLMDIILRETDRLDGLIGEFLDYVRPVKHQLVRVDVREVLAETAEALKSTEIGKAVTFVLPAGDALQPVKGDRDQLKQVAWNVFLNAAQAMNGKGTISVRAAGSRLGRAGDVEIVEIADTGPGITAEELPRIFEPFYTTKERGTGLGLAMVHKIVEAHGGHIEVDSEPGKGTTFRLVLPRWTER